MLNTTAIVTAVARPGSAGVDKEAPTGEGNPQFAQALGQATGQQCGAGQATADANDAAAEASTPQRGGVTRAESAGRKTAGARRTMQPSQRDACDAATAHAALSNPAVVGDAAPAAAQRELDDGDEAELAQAELLDLAAWLPGLPLPGGPRPEAAADVEVDADALAPSTLPRGLPESRGGVRGAIAQGEVTGLARATEAIGADGPLPGPAKPIDLGRSAAERPTQRAAMPADPTLNPARPQADGTAPQRAAEVLVQALGGERAPSGIERRNDERADPPVVGLPLPASAAAANTAGGRLFQAELSVPVVSQQFASALGTQLSVLVRDGVEHARLKLNPAEMGPIEVRIQLDGNQAQVDFSAAHPATRQALQDAAPALAQALRDSGIELSGGGVFEQPRDPRGEAQREAVPGHAIGLGLDPTTDERPPSAPPPRTLRTRGVVDLYA